MSRLRRFLVLPIISAFVAVCVALVLKQTPQFRAWTVRIEQENDTVEELKESGAVLDGPGVAGVEGVEEQQQQQQAFGSPFVPLEIEHVEGQYVRRIVAVGDIHSDYENALKVLQMSHVVDENGNWTGKVDLLVQTGDIIDRYVCNVSLMVFGI